jgi:Avidin family
MSAQREIRGATLPRRHCEEQSDDNPEAAAFAEENDLWLISKDCDVKMTRLQSPFKARGLYHMRKLFLAFFVLLASQTLAAADPLPAPSFWQNQRGSTLEIFSAGNVSGVFINRASGFQCQNIPYPVTGTSTASTVVFTVNFVQCNSQTTWRGSVRGIKMFTQWVLTYPGGKMRGKDRFMRVR